MGVSAVSTYLSWAGAYGVLINGDDGNNQIVTLFDYNVSYLNTDFLEVRGGAGDDRIVASSGVALINGGKGNDLMYFRGDSGSFVGGEGIDTVEFTALIAECGFKANNNNFLDIVTPNELLSLSIDVELVKAGDKKYYLVSDLFKAKLVPYDTLGAATNSLLASYALTPSSSSINEGSTLTTTVATTNVPSGTTLYWSVGGTGVTAADFSSGALSGSGVVGTDGKFSFAHTAANDLVTEGDETLQIKLFTDSALTVQVGSTASVTLKDTSLTPAPTFSLTPSASSINEGGTLTTSISTTGVTSGTTLYYALSGTGITAADFSSGALTGSGVVGTDGKFSFIHTAANDLTTEGDETLQIKLFSDSARTAQVGTTANVTVKDTSLPVIRGNSLYTIVDGPSWTQAEANSVKLGGHLVTVNDFEEDVSLQASFGASASLVRGTNSTGYWIGLYRDPASSGYSWNDWKWTSEQLATYQNLYFRPGTTGYEPNGGYSDSPFGMAWGDQQYPGGIPAWNDDNNGPQVGIAETPFIRRGDSAYVIVQGPTWEEAEANAVKLGGHLVTINDAVENTWLMDTFASAVNKGKENDNWNATWIGLTKSLKPDGSWSWMSGEDLDYANWYKFSAGVHPFGKLYTSHKEPGHELAPGYWNGWNSNLGVQVTTGIAEISLAPNYTPAGAPTLSGTFKAGQVITIDKTSIQDADNFSGYSVPYNYSWEVANDPGMTMMIPVWESLNTADATDGNETFTITADLTGKLIRGVVSYLDGYGTNEVVPTAGSSVTSAAIVRGNSLYTIVDGPSWTQAEANSVKLGGHLVTVNDADENLFLQDKIKSTRGEFAGNAWIGLNDVEQEGKWVWASKEANGYVNWNLSGNEPNGGTSDNYGMIYLEYLKIGTEAEKQIGKWNDANGTGNVGGGISETSFIRRGDSAYVIVQGPTWEEAEANAVKLCGHLVTINDAEENEWLTE